MEIILLKINYSSFCNALIRVVNGKICGRTIQKKGRCVTYEKLISTIHKRREQVTRVQPAVASAGEPFDDLWYRVTRCHSAVPKIIRDDVRMGKLLHRSLQTLNRPHWWFSVASGSRGPNSSFLLE